MSDAQKASQGTKGRSDTGKGDPRQSPTGPKVEIPDSGSRIDDGKVVIKGGGQDADRGGDKKGK